MRGGVGGGSYRVGQNAPIHCIPLGTLGLTGAASLAQTHKDLLLPRGGGSRDEWTGEGAAAGALLCSAPKKTQDPLPLTAHQTHRHTHLGTRNMCTHADTHSGLMVVLCAGSRVRGQRVRMRCVCVLMCLRRERKKCSCLVVQLAGMHTCGREWGGPLILSMFFFQVVIYKLMQVNGAKWNK